MTCKDTMKRKTFQCLRTILDVMIFSITNMLLVIAGLEINPGPKTKINKLSFAIWNLDSIMAINKSKIPIIESLNAVSQYSLFGLCETYLTNDILTVKLAYLAFRLPRSELTARIQKEEEREGFAFSIKKIFL